MTLLLTGVILILGVWGFFAPRSIGGFVRSWSTIGGMWLAVALRVAFAAALWLAAPLSKTETAFRALAGLVALSAAILPVFGFTRFKNSIDWWLKLPGGWVRLWCVVAIVLGCFVFKSTVRPITISVPENPVEYR